MAASANYAETLRALGLCSTGGNWQTLKKWLTEWEISTDHFQAFVNRNPPPRTARPLHEILVRGSLYSRNHLKNRLFREGLKRPVCELCGQDEMWRGRRMSLILDHINGTRDDHRLENLRIVCPNCAATLDTHCGRKNRIAHPERSCERCGTSFRPTTTHQRFCSRYCGSRAPRRGGP